MQDNPIINGFTAGELSPWLSTRFDLAQHRKGAALLNNFFIEPYGGLRRREGSRFVRHMDMITEGLATRLFAFSYSQSDNLLLLFLPAELYVIDIQNPSETPHRIETPWTTAQIIESLHFAQVNDVVYVTSPHCAPMRLTRYSNLSWVIDEHLNDASVPYLPIRTSAYPRFIRLSDEESNPDIKEAQYQIDIYRNYNFVIDENIVGNDKIIINYEAPAREYFLSESFDTKAQSVPDISTASILNPGTCIWQTEASSGFRKFYTVKRYWSSFDYKEGYDSPDDYPEYFSPGVAWLPASGNPIFVQGDWTLKTSGTWDGHWELLRSYDTSMNADGTPNYLNWSWHVVHSFYQNAHQERQNWAFAGHEAVPCTMMLVLHKAKANTVESPLYLQLSRSQYPMEFDVIAYDDAHSFKVKQNNYLIEMPYYFISEDWGFSSIGHVNGYPSFSGLHQGRLWYGGSASQPTSLWASAVDDFTHFRLGSDPSDGMLITLATDSQSRFCWMSTEKSLLLGTTEGEWLLTSSDGAGLSTSNVSFLKQSAVGSLDKPAHGVENAVFFVQRGGKRLRELSYKFESDGYTSTDTSLLAEHLFSSGIKEWVVQRGSNMRVWVMMNKGELAVLTTNASQQVLAWQRVSFQEAALISIAAVASKSHQSDDIWLILKRNGQFFLECISEEAPPIDFYTSCAVKGSGLDLDESFVGQCVNVYDEESLELLAKNIIIYSTDQSIPSIPSSGNCVLGRPVLSELATLPVEQNASFNTVSQQARIKLRLLDSDPNFQYKSTHVSHWEDYEGDSDERHYPYTGDVRVSQIPQPGVGQGFCLRCDGSRAFNLLALSIENDFHGR